MASWKAIRKQHSRFLPFLILVIIVGASMIAFLLVEGRRKEIAKFIIVSFVVPQAVLDLVRKAVHKHPQVDDDGLACSVPELTPFHKSVVDKIKTTPPSIDCEKTHRLLFMSTFNSTVVPLRNEEYFRKYGITECCYQGARRSLDGSNKIEKYERCHPVSLSGTTTVPSWHEFILIKCNDHSKPSNVTPNDVHAFVSRKLGVEQRIEKLPNAIREREKLNVVVFGIDSMSRMNFIRSMPQTYSFLMNNLSAVEMHGYNKIAVNTYPNVIPMLTSLSSSEVRKSCFSSHSKRYNCSFIWRDFSKVGYYTALLEDQAHVSLFNYGRRGILNHPPDFDLWPGSHLAENEVAGILDGTVYYCYGPRHTFDFVLDYTTKLFHKMREINRSFFQFSLVGALSHDHNNVPLLRDKYFQETLESLMLSNYFNNTIFVLLSDHGARLDPIVKTVQGQLEDRLPMLHFVFPPSFKERYNVAYNNLLVNKKRLVTSFDLHETLQDIANIENIENAKLKSRKHELYAHDNYPRGISLFLPVPKSRTCKMAGIELKYCSCLYFKTPNLKSSLVTAMTNKAVKHINNILQNHTECAQLKLANVTSVQLTDGKATNSGKGRVEGSWSYYKWEAYFISFITKPGNASYDVVMVKNWDKNQEWKINGEIARTNLYKEQSKCLENKKAKPYCYCL